jgi:hypothetical protein
MYSDAALIISTFAILAVLRVNLGALDIAHPRKRWRAGNEEKIIGNSQSVTR